MIVNFIMYKCETVLYMFLVLSVCINLFLGLWWEKLAFSQIVSVKRFQPRFQYFKENCYI